MIAALLRRALCRAGRHHVLRCAGAPDHAWTWDPARERWTAVLVPVPVRPVVPVGRFTVVAGERGMAVVPLAADRPVRAGAAPAGKNDLPRRRHGA